ncbi:Methylphloroacetophenone synthase [Colletotrichum sp. SAR 10_65]|nr:Methylphloroacetophenone synthase [Colletotrichum sp. SAR 10_65]KAI8208596.1 Methylphloroacetophenone synthase [Colletotrichum sp. SAR 10_76]
MCEYASMPASAYIEAVSRAALKLQDLDLAVWRPTVEDLTMKAPVVLKPDEEPPEILLIMRRVDNSWPSWVFSITVEPTQKAGESKVEAQETTTGMVHLRERNDPRVTQEFRRFESLIGDRRWQNIMEHSDAEAMQGKHIYRAFQGVVQYSDAFKGIKAIASLGTEAAGVVRISSDSHGTLDQRLVDTPLIDSFLQFGGFLVNYFSTTTTIDSLLVCHRIQRLQLGPAFSPVVKDWLVLANMTPENDENVSVDVYVSEAQTKKMVLVAFGMGFTKISRTSLARILRGSSKDPTLSPVTSKEEKTLQSDTNASGEVSTRNLGGSISKRSEVLKIAAIIADIPINDLTGKEALPDVGIDSLGATEMIGDIASALNVTIDFSGSGPFRILEVGAGTGGTTRHVVELLVKAGIPFEYHFTDLSASLVQKAKTSFAGINGMTFGVLDIESEPTAELTEAFHVIISTNCIHATRNITSSLANLRKMLREDGALALIEMTPTRQLLF